MSAQQALAILKQLAAGLNIAAALVAVAIKIIHFVV